ncbi:uncharacterized protein [Fopius arisanus]|uniref:Uncharacterized protein n=1 Tax=Fopius arisanus TaxID=64838 RepID=A0A9R1U0D2_9HYME|nr:PREDICTED: uncharacterized protein LOC105267354 [Fopius arisanus]XP_011304451.1 PREDICTED: uncharacterized protein LOC105267354 [Fopius arisanus]
MADLETSELVNSEGTDIPSKLIIPKRRSSIFQRRSINTRQQDYVEAINEEQKSEARKNSEDPQEEIFDLSDYISSLKKEQSAWKKTLNERKSQRRCLAKEESQVAAGVELDLSLFTDEERAFIAGRPDYDATSRSLDNLLKIAVKSVELNTQVDHLSKTIAETINQEMNVAKCQLMDLSDI